MRSAMNLAVFFMIGVSALAAPPLPEVDSGKLANLSMNSSHTEEGPTKSYEIGSTYRKGTLHPSNWGVPGLFRVRSGESLPAGSLMFGLGGEFYSVDRGPTLGLGPTGASTIAESLFVGFSVTDQLMVGIQRRNSSTTFNYFGQPNQLVSSLGDFNFTGQYSIPVTASIAIAPLANLMVASNFNDLAPAGTTLSGGLGGALSHSFFPSFELPFFIHTNLVWNSPQIRTSKIGLALEPEAFFQFSRYHTFTWALGFEYQFQDVHPFIEWQHIFHIDSPVSYLASPSKLSLGARFTPLSNKSLALLVGADVGVGRDIFSGIPYSPAWQIIGQVSYSFGLFQEERKHYVASTDVQVVNKKFVLRKNVNFKVASAELEPESTDLLDQVAQLVRDNQVRRLLILGHTDSSHTEGYNLKLSQDRAVTVKRYLVSKGIQEETLFSQGFGRRRPKASNATEEGRSLNRRVEFFVLE